MRGPPEGLTEGERRREGGDRKGVQRGGRRGGRERVRRGRRRGGRECGEEEEEKGGSVERRKERTRQTV